MEAARPRAEAIRYGPHFVRQGQLISRWGDWGALSHPRDVLLYTAARPRIK
jgi:hypothetical protein